MLLMLAGGLWLNVLRKPLVHSSRRAVASWCTVIRESRGRQWRKTSQMKGNLKNTWVQVRLNQKRKLGERVPNLSLDLKKSVEYLQSELWWRWAMGIEREESWVEKVLRTVGYKELNVTLRARKSHWRISSRGVRGKGTCIVRWSVSWGETRQEAHSEEAVESPRTKMGAWSGAVALGTG